MVVHHVRLEGLQALPGGGFAQEVAWELVARLSQYLVHRGSGACRGSTERQWLDESPGLADRLRLR